MEKLNLTDINDNNGGAHFVLLALLVLVVFALPAGLWTLAPLNEALFFMELKAGYSPRQPALTMLLFGALAGDGASLWPLRLITAGAAFVVMLSVYGCAKRLYNGSAAFWAALALAVVPLFMHYAVMGLPCMWAAALTGLPMLLWFTGTSPLSWRRWLLIWLCALAALLFGGLSSLYSILIFLAGNFLLGQNKKQRLKQARMLVPLGLFAAALVLLAVLPPAFMESWLDRRGLAQSVGGAAALVQAATWERVPQALLNNLGVWLLAFMVIMLWILGRVLRRKPIAMPYQKPLLIWFAAMLLPALLTDYDEPGRFLGVLPPLAVWIGAFMERYARYKASLPKVRAAMKNDALTLKIMLACWGLLLAALGLYLLFNLEQAWQRGIYLETREIALLGGAGLVIALLAVRTFWLKGHTCALWGFLMVMLLSFGFIHNAVLKPAGDVLHSARHFNQNLTTLFPEIRQQGVIVGVNRIANPEILKARGFLYADFPVRMRPVSADFFLLSQREALPPRLLLDDDVLASLGDAPFKAGYVPVYWEIVDGLLLTVLELGGAPETAAEILTLAARTATDAHDDLWASGYCLAGGYLVPYESLAGTAVNGTKIRRFPAQQLQIFSVNASEGLRDAYTFHWLLTAGQRYPQRHTALELYNQTAYINKHQPYGYQFQRWALNTLRTALKPDFIAFSGLNPQHNRTRRVLNKLVETDALKQAAIGGPITGITVERTGEQTFLRFRQNERILLTLELRSSF